ncbi:uncharacterized protein LOC125372326 [Haliotis rufescens]|uniref:uncharacterized protein LOC125372326 n=1 Tax=Haliotis rufescens TaxID=6454 RepID=UPI00201F6A59|nr:uncharacterized protein LOC125372326 [Haliotis rufescens]XP_048237838.1 uncharacterized protein LOC125372326 [Haliotis rufescens]
MAPWTVSVSCSLVVLTQVYITISRECSVHCLACSSDGSCVSCLAGYYGVNCTTCSPQCNNSVCLFELCAEGCVKGLYGYTCDKDCRQCEHGCDQWRGTCIDQYSAPTTPYFLAGKENVPLHVSYKIMIGIMSIAGAGVLCTICVFVKEKRFRYTTFNTVFRRRRHRPLRMRRIPRSNSTHDTFISETMSNSITVLSTDNIASCDFKTQSLTSSNSLPISTKSKIVPNNNKQNVHILISPPSPCKSPVSEQVDHPPPYVSLFP